MSTFFTADINECIVSALSGSLPCPEGEICQNTDGGYDCHCPTGTMRNEGVCEGYCNLHRLLQYIT